MKTNLTWENDDGLEETLEVPALWEICGNCAGNGKHDPEGFSNGFSAEDFAEDPEFKEDYFAGRYDVSCECCHGTGKVLVPDLDSIARNPALAAKYAVAEEALETAARCESSWRAERAAERRMGA